MINSLTVEYANKFGLSNNTVNLTYAEKIVNKTPQFDFGEYYEKVKNFLNIVIEELIIAIINKKGSKSKSIKSSITY